MIKYKHFFFFLFWHWEENKKKKIFDKKVKIKTLFKYAHRHTHTRGGIDTTRHTHIMARNVRHSNWIQIIQKRPALLFCRVVVCLLIISLISSDFNLTRHFETLKKKKNRLPREWVCVFSCAEFFFWETLNSKQIKNTGGYSKNKKKPNSFSSYILLLLKSDNVASGNQWEGRKQNFQMMISKENWHIETHTLNWKQKKSYCKEMIIFILHRDTKK